METKKSKKEILEVVQRCLISSKEIVEYWKAKNGEVDVTTQLAKAEYNALVFLAREIKE